MGFLKLEMHQIPFSAVPRWELTTLPHRASSWLGRGTSPIPLPLNAFGVSISPKWRLASDPVVLFG